MRAPHVSLAIALQLIVPLIVFSRTPCFAYVGRLASSRRQSFDVGSRLLSLNVVAMSSNTEGVEVKSSATESPDMKAYASAYKTVFDEIPCKECSASTGSIPEDLVGTYFRSGPAMFSAGSIIPPKRSAVQPKQPPVPDGQDADRMVKHPFEGDGAVLGVTFSGNKTVTSRFRYVRTAGFTNERKKGRKIYGSMDSTRELGPSAAAGLGNDFTLPLYRHHFMPGLNKQRKNTSNTRAIYWGKKLMTMWEGGLPYKLDALALSTDGRSQLGGVLKEQDPFGGKLAYDSKKERALFYANKQDGTGSELTIYEFTSKFRLVEERGGKQVTSFPGLALISDFCITENYSIFIQPKINANPMKFLLVKEPGKIASLEAGASTLHLVPRVGSSRPGKSLSIPTDSFPDAELQFCNAYEDGDEIVVDAIRSDGTSLKGSSSSEWPWASSLSQYRDETPKRSLWRYRINTRSGNISKETLSDLQCTFGVVNPSRSAQKHRYIYSAVGGLGNQVAPPQGIAKFDCETGETQTWMPKPHEFCGEPMYAARKTDTTDSAEDDGYILSVLYNGEKEESEMVVLLANDIGSGPVARIPLGLGIPHGLHGCFTASEEANWDFDMIDRRAKLADKMEEKGNMWNEVKSDFSGLGLRLDDIEEIFPDLV